MKTSLLFIAAIFLNTTLLLAEPVSMLVKGFNPMILLIIEAFLILGYLVNKWVKEFREACELNLDEINWFFFKASK